MNISVLKEPSPYCFTGNAVSFEIETDSYGAVVVEVTCNGESQKASYYPFQKGDVYSTKFDIAGYLYASDQTEEYLQGEMISLLSGFSIPYRVKIGEEYVFEGIAFKGGISNHTISVLGKEGFDIFSYRLGSHFEQFLFTTRTHSKLIKVRESELYPFVFIHPGIAISFRSGSGNTIHTAARTEDSICVMDIAAVRKNFLTQFGELPGIVEVWTAGECAFTIQVIPGHISEENYLIKFRNSLGAFELVEVAGTASHEPEVGEADIYQSLTGFGFYEDRRNRLSLKDVIKVETGYKTKEEILFIRDMVCSDESYFIYPDGSSFRCNITVDKMAYSQKQVTPTSIPLIVSDVNDSSFISPGIDRSTLVDSAGIFDNTFEEFFE